jgi:AcrR family transcriptional regulator
MPSIRHNTGSDDSLLDAARHCILAVGWKRTTLTDVARRAGVSRMTIYRRWPDMQTLLSDLMTREWSGVVERTAVGDSGSARDRLAAGVAATAGALRDNDLFRKIVHVDPELLLPYLLDRRGRTQDSILALTEAAIAEGQRDGSIRRGDATLLSRALLLAVHGFVISAETMADSGALHDQGPTLVELDAELRQLVERYLAP